MNTPLRGAKAAPRKQRLRVNSIAHLPVGLTWDTYQRGLACRVQPTGRRTWYVVYSRRNRVRWYSIGDAVAISLDAARKRAAQVLLAVADGKDPAADRQAERSGGTFEELAAVYIEQHAKRKNKSWKQAAAIVERHLIPRWGKLSAASISRADVKTMMVKIAAPMAANAALLAGSAVFSWAIKEQILPGPNPCKAVERNETRSRERVLSDSELPLFWPAFDGAGPLMGTALKVILLTGQRPGEVAKMRHEHIKDGWWEMPGEPVPELGWPGTKNGQSHRIPLSEPVHKLIAELSDGETTGYVFGNGNLGVRLPEAMRAICSRLKIGNAVRPHDLRRTFCTTVTRLGLGRETMDRVVNHRDGGVGSVYDRHRYEQEDKAAMELAASRIMTLIEGEPSGKVVPIRR